MATSRARFRVGQLVHHKLFDYRGVIFDVDPTFSNTEEWWEAIPEEIRPSKDQPFYHLLAENEETEYIAYVSEQNLLVDESGEPVAVADTGISCPSNDGFKIEMDFTAVWGVMPAPRASSVAVSAFA